MKIKDLEKKLIENTPDEISITFTFTERSAEHEYENGEVWCLDSKFEYDTIINISKHYGQYHLYFAVFLKEYKINEDTPYQKAYECWIEHLQTIFKLLYRVDMLEEARGKYPNKELDL